MANYWIIPEEPRCICLEHVITLSRRDMEVAAPVIDTILDNTVDAAALISRERRVIYLSKGFEELTGQSLAEYQEHLIDELKIDGQAHIDRVLSDGVRQMAVPMEVGSRRLLTNLVPIVSDGEIIGVMLLIVFRSTAVLKRAIQTLERSLEQTETVTPESGRTSGYTFSDFIGEAENVVLTIEQCQRISQTYHPVLLIGETGVGKEIIADAIYHEYSQGRTIPFVKINCSAIPRDLLESELFGHEKGAFTGATSLKKGKFEQAAGGVLLLDEIGEMSFELQSKLLRVLEAREFERIGGSRVIPMRARIIASTNQDLKRLVAEGKFRMDLYYRLNTFEINIPPLRAHKEDIPLLIQHFIDQDGLKLEFNQDAREMLMRYDWPGNVRELRNVLNRMSFLYPNTVIGIKQVYNATGDMFHLVHLPEYRSQLDPIPEPTMDRQGNPLPPKAESAAQADPAPAGTPSPSDPEEPLLTLAEYEKQAVQRAIEQAHGNLTEAAALIGVSRSTMYNKAKRYGLIP